MGNGYVTLDIDEVEKLLQEINKYADDLQEQATNMYTRIAQTMKWSGDSAHSAKELLISAMQDTFYLIALAKNETANLDKATHAIHAYDKYPYDQSHEHLHPEAPNAGPTESGEVHTKPHHGVVPLPLIVPMPAKSYPIRSMSSVPMPDFPHLHL